MSKGYIVLILGFIICLAFTHFLFDTMSKSGLLDKHTPQYRRVLFITAYILSPLYMLGFIIVVIKSFTKGIKDGYQETEKSHPED